MYLFAIYMSCLVKYFTSVLILAFIFADCSYILFELYTFQLSNGTFQVIRYLICNIYFYSVTCLFIIFKSEYLKFL